MSPPMTVPPAPKTPVSSYGPTRVPGLIGTSGYRASDYRAIGLSGYRAIGGLSGCLRLN